MTRRKLYQELSNLIAAYELGNSASRDEAEVMTEEFMPSGSGIDSGTKLDLGRSNPNKLVFTFSYHHMDEYGFYDGWTHHTCVVKPSFDGIDIRITGRDRNQIKEYLYQTFDWALNRDVMFYIRQKFFDIRLETVWKDQSYIEGYNAYVGGKLLGLYPSIERAELEVVKHLDTLSQDELNKVRVK